MMVGIMKSEFSRMRITASIVAMFSLLAAQSGHALAQTETGVPEETSAEVTAAADDTAATETQASEPTADTEEGVTTEDGAPADEGEVLELCDPEIDGVECETTASAEDCETVAIETCDEEDAACLEEKRAECLANATAAADTAEFDTKPSRFQPVFDIIDAGGPIIVILAGLSVISLAIIIVKLFQFTALRVGDRGFIDKASRMIRDGDAEDALDFLSRRAGVIARVMETALRGKIHSDDEEHVREEVARVAQIKLDGLERGLPLLSLIATISPLLGLLGTVLGMIEAFQQLENAGDRVDPAILSGGIWEALLTTAAGLSVAIPAAAFFTWLQRTVDVAGQHMENAATQVFTADIYGDDKKKRAASGDDE